MPPRRKIPPDAFSYYVSLGPAGSYEALAKHYRVSKRAVTRLAVKEGWQGKLKELHSRAQAGALEKLRESLEAMNERHLKVTRVVMSRALEALRAMPLGTSMAVLRALDMAIKHERAIRGEGEKAEDLAELIRHECERWIRTQVVGKAQDRGDEGDGARREGGEPP